MEVKWEENQEKAWFTQMLGVEEGKQMLAGECQVSAVMGG